MNFRHIRFTIGAALACIAAFGQSTVAIPSTGAARSPDGTQDLNWTITFNNIDGESGTGKAAIVTKALQGNGWATPATGLSWIGPAQDQSNAPRPGTCCHGHVVYQATFNVTDPATAQFTMKIGADDEVLYTYLNSQDDANIVYFSSAVEGTTWNNPASITVKQNASYTDPAGQNHTPHFITGPNTIIVVVDNDTGGPTGLYIDFTQPPAATPKSVTDASLADGQANSVSDPIDSGSGQFYDEEIDFRLGGPMQLGFSRYYASKFSNSGFTSALGTNWMGTYDIFAVVSTTEVQVMLFGGRVITFANSGGLWQLQSPAKLPYQLVAAGGGGKLKFLDPTTGLVYTFSATGQLNRIEDRNGNALAVTPGDNGPAKVSDNTGRTLTFTYSAGLLTSVTDQSGRAVTYTYSNRLLASVTDPMSAVTNYTYTSAGTASGLLTREILPLGNAPVTQTYDSTGRAVTQADAGGNTTGIAYDGLGGTTITDPAGNITRHQNDALGDITQFTDPLGGTASLTYDRLDRPTSITRKSGGILQYSYDPQSGSIAVIIDPNNNTTAYTYTAQPQNGFTFFQVSGVTDPDGGTTANTYDPSGNLLTSTLPDLSTISFGYDNQGRVTTATNALGQVSTYGWNADGTLTLNADPLGNTTQYQYDALKRRSKVTDPNGSTANFTYDGNGRPITTASPGGAPWTLHYDADGQRDSILNPMGGTYKFTFTPMGKVASSTDPMNNTETYSYDNLNRLTTVSNGAGEAVTSTYDNGGRIIATADNSGPRDQFAYDADGHLTSQTDATGRTFSYIRDAANRVTSITSPGANVTQYSYDWRGNLLTQTNPLGEQYSRTYDSMGRLTGVIAPGGLTTAVQRDAVGQPTSLTSANGNTWAMAYDGAERLASITDPLGNSTNYTYTGTRLTGLAFPLGSVTFSYAANGYRIKSAYSDGTVINKSPNGMGLTVSADNVTIARNSMGLPTNVNGIGITYDGAGKPLTLTYATGMDVTYAYDAAGRIASISDWIGGVTSFTYDAASRRSSQTYPNGVATTYGYDPDGRINSIVYGTLGSIALTLDATGKILASDRNLPIAPALQDETDQLAYNAAGQSTSATYDTMGRVTAQGARTYNWNLASQLTSFADPLSSAAITYDGLGEINSSTASGALQTYVFNHAMSLPGLSIVRQDGNDVTYYVYLPSGELLYAIDAATAERSYYHFDDSGNTAFLTDDSGAVTDSYGITPYGEVSDHIGASANPFTWQGQFGVIQEAAALFYMRNRHFDASTARFLSTDPMISTDPRASEPYAYAGGNPLTYHDPYGTDWWNPFTWFQPAPAKTAAASAPRKADPQPKTPASVTDTCSTVACLLPKASAVINHDGGSLKDVNQLFKDLSSLISQDGSSLAGINLATLISQDGSGLISQDGSSLLRADLNALIGQDGSGLVAKDALALISQDGSGLISQLISQDGSSLVAQAKTSLVAEQAALLSQDGAGLALQTAAGLAQGSQGAYELSAASNFNLSINAYKSVGRTCPQAKNNKK